MFAAVLDASRRIKLWCAHVEYLHQDLHLRKPSSLVPRLFFAVEGKNSLVNGLFRFCCKCHIGGTPIRLVHVNDVIYCNQWRQGSLSTIQETKPDGARERTRKRIPKFLLNQWCVFLSLSLAVWSSWASNVDKIVWGWQRLHLNTLRHWSLNRTEWKWNRLLFFPSPCGKIVWAWDYRPSFHFSEGLGTATLSNGLWLHNLREWILHVDYLFE